MATVADVWWIVKDHQMHYQLSVREAEMIITRIQELLTMTSCADGNTLKYIAGFLTPVTYRMIVLSRNLQAGKCGYPLCRRFLTDDVYTSPESCCYCSDYHYRCSKYISIQLYDEDLEERLGQHLRKAYDDDDSSYKYKVDLLEQYTEALDTEELDGLSSSFTSLGIRSNNIY
ncbi:hypothetical protein RNJ44_03720 [Nakaseomyces bracarensis]|uniref:protein-serine/threonine phosphatase n=1 Tax=Nakaseomyces bracarensis TaxID=273131 RepID=A0ABR4NXR3_9SACH